MPGLYDALGIPVPSGLQVVDPARPINWDNPLSVGLVTLLKVTATPGWSGGLTLRDLVCGDHYPNNGTLQGTLGTAVKWQGPAGRPGGAGSLLFAGTSGDVDCGKNAATQDLDHGPMSAACWFNYVSLGSSDLLGRNDGNSINTGWTMGYNSGRGGLGFESERGGQDCKKRYAFTNSGAWHHLVATYDGGLSASGITIYLDGVSPPSGTVTTQAGSGTQGSDADEHFYVGRSRFNSTYPNALIDEVALWKLILSPGDVAALYQSSRLGLPGLLNYPYLGTTEYSFPPAGGATSGAGQFDGTSSGAGVGAALDAGAGAANGTSSGAGTGAALDAGSGEADGSSSGAATGAAIDAGSGSSGGTSSGAGTGAALDAGAGSSSGPASGAGAGAALAASAGEADGSSSGAGVSASGASAGQSDGTSSGSGAGSALASVAGSGAGSSSGAATSAGAGGGGGSAEVHYFRRRSPTPRRRATAAGRADGTSSGSGGGATRRTPPPPPPLRRKREPALAAPKLRPPTPPPPPPAPGPVVPTRARAEGEGLAGATVLAVGRRVRDRALRRRVEETLLALGRLFPD